MDKMPDGVIAKVLENHTAILGKTGSGKSNAAKWMAEGLLDRGERVCAVDPTGTWWGMRLKRDGKPSKYKPIIFGGKHADIPILPEHGAAIAEAIGGSKDSAIIDVREMSVAGRTKFFTAFAEHLLRVNVGALHLVLDEAHLFAPQGRVNDPQSGIMLNATNNLISLGRGNGIRAVLVSQRPAKLHKDSLTQVETMIAMRLIAPQDRAAILDWVGEWGDISRGKEIVASLPSLPVGHGWVWAPEQKYLELVAFPLVKTYDTGRPNDDVPFNTSAIDVAEITKRLETIAADVVANDPKKLKARVAELETAIGRAKAAPPPTSAHDLQGARDGGYFEGWDEGTEAGYHDGYQKGYWDARQALTTMISDDMQKLADAILGSGGGKVEDIVVPLNEATLEMAAVKAAGKAMRGHTAANAEAQAIVHRGVLVKSKDVGALAPYVPPANPIGVVVDRQDAGITGPQARILTALKVWKVLGHELPTRHMVASFAGYSATTKSYKNALSELRTAARIDYESTGVRLLIDWDDTNLEEAFKIFRGQLSGVERSICNAIGQRTISRVELAEATNYSPTTKSFKNAVSSLSGKTVLEYAGVGRTSVFLHSWVRELLERFGEL